MIKTIRRFSGAIVVMTLLATLFVSPVAAAAPSYTLFGDATYVSPGNASSRAVQATSTGTKAYGGVDFTLPIPTVTTLASLNNLSTDYKATVGSCGLGSPRFAVEVQKPDMTKANVFFYIGPPPNYNTCPPNVWTNSGNLAAPANLVDTSQLGGTFYDPYASAQTKYGSYPITDIALVVDGTNQTFQFDNTKINTTTYTYEPVPLTNASQCKNGGYKNFTDPRTGKPFANQGQCVAFVENHNDGGHDQNGNNDDGGSGHNGNNDDSGKHGND